ncbi:MAG: Gfo/Idh/MocA family oxidoreductase [Lentisphaeraceae bacterium]|nr:Gfo/Idh/MocA family oxidoreductase [Lentisphaeraceae bacterium]
MDAFNRRAFVKASAAAGALSSINAFSVSKPTANDTEIKIALVGCGGRGSGAIVQAMNVRKGIKLVAMADAFGDKVESSLAKVTKVHGDRVDVPESRRFSGFDAYKKAIDTDCDLVILATPPHFRPIHLEYAVNKKKHVFMEKPVAVDGPGVRSVIESAAKAKSNSTMLAVGLQRRHQFDYNESVAQCQDGAIGDFQYAEVWWNSGGVWTRPRQDGQSEMEYQMRNWYYFNWLCGDHIVEQHIHNLDVINWMKNGFPVKASGMGGRQVRNGIDNGEIYDHFAVTYEYADGSKMFSQARHIPNCDNKVSEIAYGTKGTCNFGRHSITVGGKRSWRFRGKKVNGHQHEWVDLINSLDKGEIYNEGEYGAYSTMTAILGRMATYYGKEITWEQALNSELKLSPETYAWDANPPTLPNKNGRYTIPMPGKNKPF